MPHFSFFIRCAGVALAPFALAACAGGEQLPPATYSMGPIAPSEDYTNGPLDEITIHVWRNPELSADKVRVRPDGRLTIPLVQDIPAMGKTATELQEYIAEQLSKYIQQPIVSVIVNTPEGNFIQQVRVIGATAQPASLPYRANMSVLDAMIAVGGFNEFAADILTKVDRTSMAVSLEAREPLLDHRLIEFAATLPEAMRVKGHTGKYLLKRAMEGRLPHEILYRPKQGLVTPIAEWLRGPLAGEARAIAISGVLAETGFFSALALAALAEAHIAGRSDNSRSLWQLMMLERSLTHLGVSG